MTVLGLTPALAACVVAEAPPPAASTPPPAIQSGMPGACQTYAASRFGVAPGTVQVKYEGQRVDGTHAVNGSAVVSGIPRTFQCSFDPSGTQVVDFVVN
jgi:hypothetical protein